MKTHRQKVLEYYGMEDRGYSIPELSEITGYSIPVLQEVYDRGWGAYIDPKTGTVSDSVRLKGSFKKGIHDPTGKKKLSRSMWAKSRIWSFISGNPKHDNDLRDDLHTK
jgi:hypothetical protein